MVIIVDMEYEAWSFLTIHMFQIKALAKMPHKSFAILGDYFFQIPKDPP